MFVNSFWFGIALLLYTYFLYPVLLILLDTIYPSQETASAEGDKRKSVSILIAAYNEEEVIDDKIKNCLNLDYTDELLDFWVASDGSSDKTNQIVKTFEKKHQKVTLLEFPRRGKFAALNKAMPYLKSDIVVFSDANIEYSTDAIKELVKHFSDPQVGCVCGRLIYRNPGKVLSGEGESLYWRYETNLKKRESKLGYVAGANGAIYAIRRELFEPLPAGTINDDFLISMRIVQKGYKCLYEEQALAYEDVAPSTESEFKRHVRDGAGHYRAVTHLLGLLNPLTGVQSLIYWSHRILRWTAPFILIALYLINIALIDQVFYRNFFIFHSGFYVLAIAGLIISMKSKKMPLFLYLPSYFCNLNLALFLGFLKAVTGRQKVAWDSTSRSLSD